MKQYATFSIFLHKLTKETVNWKLAHHSIGDSCRDKKQHVKWGSYCSVLYTLGILHPIMFRPTVWGIVISVDRAHMDRDIFNLCLPIELLSILVNPCLWWFVEYSSWCKSGPLIFIGITVTVLEIYPVVLSFSYLNTQNFSQDKQSIWTNTPYKSLQRLVTDT